MVDISVVYYYKRLGRLSAKQLGAFQAAVISYNSGNV